MPTPTVVRAILQIVDDAIATNDPLHYEQLLRALQMLLDERSEPICEL